MAGPRIRDVWAQNLEAEMRIIRELVDDYPMIALVRPVLSILSLAHWM
jgi:hypothetical protein